MKIHLSLLFCALLSGLVLHTCVQIEVWNHLAGGKVLPNRERGKLHYSPGEDEDSWRGRQARKTDDPSLMSGRSLTVDEQALFQAARKRAHARNTVVGWTRGMGTLQYLLAPIAGIWSILLFAGNKALRLRLLAGLLVLSNAACIVMMLCRGYFND